MQFEDQLPHPKLAHRQAPRHHHHRSSNHNEAKLKAAPLVVRDCASANPQADHAKATALDKFGKEEE